MRSASVVLVVMLGNCVFSVAALSGSKPQKPVIREIMAEVIYPKPGQPNFAPMLKEITDRIASSKVLLKECVRKFIDPKVTSDSDSHILSRQACMACKREDRATSDAMNDFFRFNNGWSPNYRGDNTKDKIPFKPGECAEGLIYAFSAISVKAEIKKRALEPVLEANMQLKLQPASECNKKFSTLFVAILKVSPPKPLGNSFKYKGCIAK